MPGTGPAQSEEELTGELLRRAEEMWGPERLEAIRPMVGQTAQHLWIISNHAMDLEGEPTLFT